MNKFKFKLESVLRKRKLDENSALRMLAESQRKFQVEVENKKNIISELEKSFKHREDLGNVPASTSDFFFIQNYINGLKLKIIKSDQSILRANRGVEKSLKFYLGQKKLSKMIESLREKAVIDFSKELSKREQKEMDDLTVMRNRLESDFREKLSDEN